MRVFTTPAKIEPASKEGLLTSIRGLLSSKKALTALGTVLAIGAGKVGVDLSDEMTTTLAGIGITLILGFAAQDVGKEKARLLQ